MGFDRYRCVLDRIFPFLKLPEYRRRFRFRKYRTAFVSDEKNVKTKMVESFADRFRPFSSLISMRVSVKKKRKVIFQIRRRTLRVTA